MAPCAGQEIGLFERVGLDEVSQSTSNPVETTLNVEHGRSDLVLSATETDEGEREAGPGAVDFVAAGRAEPPPRAVLRVRHMPSLSPEDVTFTLIAVS